MSSPWERAVAAVEQKTGHPAREALSRVEAGRDGRLVLTARARPAPRWFAWKGDALRELLPGQDASLPLAAALEGLAASEGAEILSWRPGRRIVVRVAGAEGPRVVKGFRRRRMEPSLLRHAHARRLGGPDSFLVPECSPFTAPESLVMGLLEGRNPPLGPGAAPAFADLGARLRRLQAGPTDGLESRHDRPAELGVLDRLAARTQPWVQSLPAGWREARERLEDLAVPAPAAGPVPVHRDLHDGQLLLTDRGPALLDFDLLCGGEPAVDPGNLLAHLDLRGLQGRRGADPEGMRHLGQAFLEGLGRGGEDGFEAALRFYHAATLLRLALLYRLRPRWAALAGPLVQQAARLLDATEVAVRPKG